MQNALYFENSHVGPVPLLNGVKKKIPTTDNLKKIYIYLLLTEQEVCMGESWPRSWVQTERSEVCTHDRGQDSPIQTD